MGAPVGIALIAGIAIPAMIIGIPVYVGRKVRLWRQIHIVGRKVWNSFHYMGQAEHWLILTDTSDLRICHCVDLLLKHLTALSCVDYYKHMWFLSISF